MMTGCTDSEERNKQRRAGQEKPRTSCTNTTIDCRGDLVVIVKEACTGQFLRSVKVEVCRSPCPENQTRITKTDTTNTEGKTLFKNMPSDKYLITADGTNIRYDKSSVETMVNVNETKVVELTLKGEGVLIIYGHGGDLGDFGVFANWLRKDLIKKENYGIAEGKYDEDKVTTPLNLESKKTFSPI
ncbi:MAG: hypothetical protein HC877_23605 [Thioploca sp.]|nr:hypothetical protein [Thioploca sp.]